MKQKRNVKSLIPSKNRDSNLLTILLLFLSLILCLCSASLMTLSVWVVANDEGSPVTWYSVPYSWHDNSTEVIYNLELADENALWNAESLDEFYIENNNLYLSWKSVRIDETGDVNKYVNLLWWLSNEIYSDNITVIAWFHNIVSSGNDNATILWWDENILSWNYYWVPIVVAWWNNNMIENSDWAVVLWWKENKIGLSSNGVVLWWEFNFVSGWNNVIIGWRNVKVNEKNNIFAFSNEDSDFEPEDSDAFYLNLIDWVWINSDSEKEWMSVSGAIWFWNIDIENVPCNDNNIWVEWARNWCLVWCTEESKSNSNKWELLDHWGRCEEICNNDKCIFKVFTGLEEIPDYTGFCLTDHIDVSNATRCTTWENESYENVVFWSVLIDYEAECPTTGNNKCVYRCNPETHLTWDAVWWTNAVMCYKDCELPWGETIKHNETRIAYNIENVTCSNDVYVFPYQTEIINKPVNTYQIWNKSINGIVYQNRDKNGKSFESCGNYDHKKTLVCLSWSLYLLGSDGKADKTTKTVAELYKYQSCNLHDYKCDTWVYLLTQQRIAEDKEDVPKNGSRVVADRGILTWERWQYKLCVDYDANPVENWESCAIGETSYHYQFTKCQSWYDLQSDGVCRKRCTLIWINWKSSWYVHGTIITWYISTWAVCTWTCQSEQIVCNDWTWRLWSFVGEENTTYLYDDCVLGNKVCSSNYNVEQSIVTNSGQHSIYESCDPYDASGKFECVKKDTVYNLVDCEEWYHTEDNLYCVPNQKNVDCNKIAGKYDGDGSYVDAKVTVDWQWEWNTWHWTNPSECEWKCDAWYHLSGFVCVSDTRLVNCSVPLWQDNYKIEQVAITWESGDWTSPIRCNCIDWFRQEWDRCVSTYVCTWAIPLDAYFITWSDENLWEDTVRWAYKDDELEGNKCAYACNSGFLAYEWLCYPCEYWELDEEGRCVNPLMCTDPSKPYFYNGECYAELWACKYNNAQYNLNNLSHVIEKVWLIEPINPTEVLDVKCVDADDPDWWSVEKNSCSYSCEEWYYCNGVKCAKPYCRFDARAGQVGFYYTWWIPSHHNFWKTYCRTDDGDFLSYPVTVSGFLDKFGKWVGEDGDACGGCFFWCPEKDRFYYETDPDNFRCLDSSLYKNCDYAWSSDVERWKENAYFSWWLWNPETREQKKWTYYNSRSDFLSAYRRWETCIRSCNWQWDPITGYKLASPWSKNLFQATKWELYCYKKCGSSQYYSGDGKCYTCPSGKILTWLAKTVINGVTYSEYRLCIDDCQSPLVWNATYGCIKNCGAWLQWSGSVGDCVSKCSAWQEWSTTQNKCVSKCSVGEEWSTTQNMCVSKCSVGEEWSTTQNKCVSKCDEASWKIWSESVGGCVDICPSSATWDGLRCLSNPIPAGCPNPGEVSCGGKCISCRQGQHVNTSTCQCVDN